MRMKGVESMRVCQEGWGGWGGGRGGTCEGGVAQTTSRPAREHPFVGRTLWLRPASTTIAESDEATVVVVVVVVVVVCRNFEICNMARHIMITS
jgi:hypothetical protein